MDAMEVDEDPRADSVGLARDGGRSAQPAQGSGDVLAKFLDAGLIDVGGDDAKFESLRLGASDLAERLISSPLLMVPFTAAACDPEAAATHPAIEDAGVALRARWATFKNTFRHTPVAVLRALLLDAVLSAAARSDLLAAAFASTARNRLPFMKLAHEASIWAGVVARAERQVEKRARHEWATPAQLLPPELEIEPPEPINIGGKLQGIDRDSLIKLIAAATGPNNSANQPTQGNPHWPNQVQAWASEFAPRMADVIIGALATAGKTLSAQELDLAPALDTVAVAVRAHTESAFERLNAATEGLRRRNDLIWWRQSLYSQTAMFSYRDLPPSGAAALMAYDLYLLVPTFSPASVTAFLRETLLDLPVAGPPSSRPIWELASELATLPALRPVREAAGKLFEKALPGGPLLGVIAHVGPGGIPVGQAFRNLVRLDPDEPLTAEQWSEFLFRELQAARAIREASSAPQAGA
jgi:hypothetical protein